MESDKAEHFFINSGIKLPEFNLLKNKIGKDEISILTNVDVLKEHRNKGIGKKMIVEFLEESIGFVLLIIGVLGSKQWLI